jgi:uncharacterized protein YjbI with pentapeptide repeats
MTKTIKINYFMTRIEDGSTDLAILSYLPTRALMQVMLVNSRLAGLGRQAVKRSCASILPKASALLKDGKFGEFQEQYHHFKKILVTNQSVVDAYFDALKGKPEEKVLQYLTYSLLVPMRFINNDQLILAVKEAKNFYSDSWYNKAFQSSVGISQAGAGLTSFKKYLAKKEMQRDEEFDIGITRYLKLFKFLRDSALKKINDTNGIVNLSGAELFFDDETLSDEEEFFCRYAALPNSNFNGATFRRPGFSNTDLSHSTFVKAQLGSADFDGATLNNADFSHANLVGANFYNAKLGTISFRHANLGGAKLWKATFDWMDLRGTNLAHASIPNWPFNKYTQVAFTSQCDVLLNNEIIPALIKKLNYFSERMYGSGKPSVIVAEKYSCIYDLFHDLVAPDSRLKTSGKQNQQKLKEVLEAWCEKAKPILGQHRDFKGKFVAKVVAPVLTKFFSLPKTTGAPKSMLLITAIESCVDKLKTPEEKPKLIGSSL